jgi:hypothetical protein
MNKPTELELYGYFIELACNNPKAESEKFFDYFESVGWRIGGRSPMRDWKAAVRNWVRRIKEREVKVETKTFLKSVVEQPTRTVNNEPKPVVQECAPPPEDWRKLIQDLANKKKAF